MKLILRVGSHRATTILIAIVQIEMYVHMFKMKFKNSNKCGNWLLGLMKLPS